MADALLLSSQRALPQKLEQMGHRLTHPDLEPALVSIFGQAR
jgi:NAD dependent epimerase/dehydratase family enzyme